MKSLVDVVNFNADASCLSSGRWLEVLKGGEQSELYKWLSLYIKYQKKVVLGFTGATIADIATFNHQAINLINKNVHLFEHVWRPFAHDLALLRTEEGFVENICIGKSVIDREFVNVTDYFLPPEFMLTAEQLLLLSQQNACGTFINPQRFPAEIQTRIPHGHYGIKGILGVIINCIGFDGRLTDYYLMALHQYNAVPWNRQILKNPTDISFSWRDGESSFFIPNGLKREEYWLKYESKTIHRQFLKETLLKFQPPDSLKDGIFHSYPIHSIIAWLKELRMWGFLKKIQDKEEKLKTLSLEEKMLWLHVINSDILSSVEKESPVIKLKLAPQNGKTINFSIQRSERGFEGEDFLGILERFKQSKETAEYFLKSDSSHMRKIRARSAYLKKLLAG